MPFCRSCNAQVKDADKFCSICGAFVGEGVEKAEAEGYFESLKTNLKQAVDKLEKAHRDFENKGFDSALKATEDVESLLKDSSGFIEQIRGVINFARARKAVNHAEAELILTRAKITAFKEEKRDADSRGVGVRKINKILDDIEAAMKIAAKILESSKAALKDGNIKRVKLKVQESLDHLSTVSGLLDSCRKELRLSEDKAQNKAQKRLEDVNNEYRRASLYLDDAAKSGAAVEELAPKLDSIREARVNASTAISKGRYNVAETEADSAISKAKEIVEQARMLKFDYLTRKALEAAMPRIRGASADIFARLAEEARLSHRFPEAVVLMNKVLIATQIQSLQENVARLEDYLRKADLFFDLTSAKEGINTAQRLLEDEEWRDAIHSLSRSAEQLKEIASVLNTYAEVRDSLNQVKELFFMSIKKDTGMVEKALTDASELMKKGKLDECTSLLLETKDEIEKYKLELKGKFRKAPILGFFRYISRSIKGKPKYAPLEKFELSYEGITEKDLITVEYTEPEI